MHRFLGLPFKLAAPGGTVHPSRRALFPQFQEPQLLLQETQGS